MTTDADTTVICMMVRVTVTKGFTYFISSKQKIVGFDRKLSQTRLHLLTRVQSRFRCFLLLLDSQERFSCDLQKKTREQNRNKKRTEIERFEWFIEQI